MKMREDEIIAKYVERIKASVSAIRALQGKIEENIVASKVLRTPSYLCNQIIYYSKGKM